MVVRHSRSKLEHEIPRFTRNKLRNLERRLPRFARNDRGELLNNKIFEVCHGYRGGRIGKTQAFLGDLLKVNPILGIKNGDTFPIARVRSRAQAIDFLVNFAKSFKKVEALAIEDVTTSNELEILGQRLQGLVPQERFYRSKVSPVVGTHVGPHVLSVSALEGE